MSRFCFRAVSVQVNTFCIPSSGAMRHPLPRARGQLPSPTCGRGAMRFEFRTHKFQPEPLPCPANGIGEKNMQKEMQ